ncbi:hypothetical protein C5B85_12715 [Pseudoclavibacter sp. AY1F1]|nr:hypothetical protein C5B85_12715 [Pseudoclavibacter sp. AY1F1]
MGHARSYDLVMTEPLNASQASGASGAGAPWRPRLPLRAMLGAKPISVADARKAGVGRGALSNKGLERPFYGVRQVPPQPPRASSQARGPSLDEFQVLRIRQRRRILAYVPRLRPGQAFGPRTTALLHGLPLPLRMLRDSTVDVIVPQGACRPNAAGVQARGVPGRIFDVQTVNGVPCAPPELLYCLLARDLSEVDLLAVGDALITEADNYPNRTWFTALSSAEQLAAAVIRWSPGTGSAKLRKVTPMIRPGVESPYETSMRFHLHESGYPELTLQLSIFHDGVELARADGADLEARILYDFDGDGHRVDKRQFRKDVRRPRLLRMLGWHDERLTVEDLEPSPDAFVKYAHELRRRRLEELARQAPRA